MSPTLGERGKGFGLWGGGNVLFVLSKLCKFISQGVISELCKYRFTPRPGALTGEPTPISPDSGMSVVHVGQPTHWSRTKCDTLILPPIMVATAAQDGTPKLPSLSKVKGWLQPLGLLTGREDEETLRRRHTVMSKCTFGKELPTPAQRQFL